MSKVVLGKRPEAFAPVVAKFKMPDGSDGGIECTFRYRTRKEHGRWVDDLAEQGRARIEADIASTAPLAGVGAFASQAEAIAVNADYLLGALVAWGLDEPLARESCEQLCDELPGAAMAVMQRYREVVHEGRLGN